MAIKINPVSFPTTVRMPPLRGYVKRIVAGSRRSECAVPAHAEGLLGNPRLRSSGVPVKLNLRVHACTHGLAGEVRIGEVLRFQALRARPLVRMERRPWHRDR